MLPTREKSHVEMFQELLTCEQCKDKVEDKIIERLYQTRRLGEVIKRIVCDGQGCRVLKCRGSTCRWELVDGEERPTKAGSAFNISLGAKT